MQSSDRDRSYIACIALCFAALILAAPAAALYADFSIYENGTGYSAEVAIEGLAEYQFTRPGILGEPVPTTVRNIRLSNSSGDVAFEAAQKSEITFPHGDYILFYEGDLDGNSFSAIFSKSHNVTLHLPHPYLIENPLLGYISQGGDLRYDDNALVITWEDTRYIEVRFYDEIREIILYAFGTIWLTIMIILLFGYYLIRIKKRE